MLHDSITCVILDWTNRNGSYWHNCTALVQFSAPTEGPTHSFKMYDIFQGKTIVFYLLCYIFELKYFYRWKEIFPFIPIHVAYFKIYWGVLLVVFYIVSFGYHLLTYWTVWIIDIYIGKYTLSLKYILLFPISLLD